MTRVPLERSGAGPGRGCLGELLGTDMDNDKRLLLVLAHSDYALTAAQFQRQTGMEIGEVESTLELLVAQGILVFDPPVYYFAEADRAQQAYDLARGGLA